MKESERNPVFPAPTWVKQRPEALRVVRLAPCAPVCTVPPLLAVLCQVNRGPAAGSSFEGVANGGVSVSAMAQVVIVGLL
ncbi:hypothetical protein GCM10023080_054470 [Streptomyces pseudoechinosporeus]